MEPKQSGRHPSVELEREDVERSLHDLRVALTATFGYAQLLERRSRTGQPSTPEQVDRAAGFIGSASVEMLRVIRQLEAACMDERGD